jgi:diguanylate cyclase (GGDEF)-like protein
MAVMTPPPRDFDRLCRPRLPRFRDSWVSIEILDDSDHRYTTKIDGSRSDAIRDTMKLPKVAYFENESQQMCMIDAMWIDSWWIFVLVAAASAGLGTAVVRLRLAAARRRERELKTLVDLRTRELRSLGSLTDKINHAVRLDDVLEHVWDSFRMVVPYNRIGFADYNSLRREVRAVWARSDASEIKIDTGYTAAIDSTSLGTILETGKPRIIDDLERYLAEHPRSGATRAVVEEGMRSSLTVPLEAMGHKVGFLFFSSQSPNIYTSEHARLLERISGQLSLAIEKSRLYDSLLETTRKLEEANERLERAASTDGLTKVANRRVFDERLNTEWRRCRRSGQPLSVLMIDIDHFKEFNDRHGHIAGDRCLRAVAATMSSTIARAADLVARYGGEEFGAILPETDDKRATRLAEELRSRIETLDLPDLPPSATITISIGVATEVPTAGRSAEGLIRRADANLYVAKNEGRNLVHANRRIELPKGYLDSDA